MRDIYSQVREINARSRSRRVWKRRRATMASFAKTALVALACLAAIALAVPAGLVFGAAFS